MIRNLVSLIVLAVAITACTGNTEKTTGDNSTSEAVEATANEIPEVMLADFDNQAGQYVDKEIKVAGLVDHVCKHGGKKLFLVSDDADLHVESDERFDEALIGSHVMVDGIVREFKVDEAYCLKMEEDNIKSHSEGETDDELFKQKMEQINWYRDSMKTANTDHLSFYSLDYVSLDVTQAAPDEDAGNEADEGEEEHHEGDND